MPRQREEELRLERGAGTISVEIRQERVVGVVQHDRRVEARAKPIGQQRFSDAGWSLDGDITEVQG